MNMVTQKQYNTAIQNNRTIFAQIKLLNHKLQVVDEISGTVIPSPSLTVDSKSDLRRSCSLSIIPTDSSFDIKHGSKIWLDKYLQIFIGIKENNTQDIIYNNQGIYLINNPSRVYDAMNDTITIEGLDLVAKLTGLRNGNLEGVEHIIKKGENIRTAIIQTIKLAGFTKYVVDECIYPTVPNDIIVDLGGNIWDLLTELRDIIPEYEMYFDVDGVFHYHKIPTGKNEQVVVNDDLWQKVLISYQYNTDFSYLKNSIEVFGKSWDLDDNYLGDATFSNNVYTVSKESDIAENDIIGFSTENASNAPSITITNQVTGLPVYTDETMEERPIFDDVATYRVFKYMGDYFIYQGEVTPYAKAEEINPLSPYYVDGNLGVINIVLSGGEYDNITNIRLAQERANWELYTRCRLLDTVSITCIPIYWLDVNIVVEITLPKQETQLYIVKDINTSIDINGTQTITLMKYYSEFETF